MCLASNEQIVEKKEWWIREVVSMGTAHFIKNFVKKKRRSELEESQSPRPFPTVVSVHVWLIDYP